MANNPGSRNTPLLGPLSMVAHLHNVPRVGKAEGGPPRRKRPTTLGAAVNEWWGADTFKDSPNPQHRQLEDVNQAIESITKRRTNADTLHVRPGYSEHGGEPRDRDAPMLGTLSGNADGAGSGLTKGFSEGGDVPGGGGTTRRNVLRGLLGAGAALGVGVAKKGKGVVDSMLESKEVPAMTKAVKGIHGPVGEGIHDWFGNNINSIHDEKIPHEVRAFFSGEDHISPQTVQHLKESLAESMGVDLPTLEKQLKESKISDEQLIKILDQKMTAFSLHEAGEPSMNGKLRPWEQFKKEQTGDIDPGMLKSSGAEAQMRSQHASDVLHMLRRPGMYSPEELKSFGIHEGYTPPPVEALRGSNHPDRVLMDHVKGHPIEPVAREAFDIQYPPDSFVHQLPQD